MRRSTTGSQDCFVTPDFRAKNQIAKELWAAYRLTAVGPVRFELTISAPPGMRHANPRARGFSQHPKSPGKYARFCASRTSQRPKVTRSQNEYFYENVRAGYENVRARAFQEFSISTAMGAI